MLPQRCPPDTGRPFIAYLSDPLAVGGVDPLLRQKRAVERLASVLGGHIERWCVDSGRRFVGQRCGDALLGLLNDMRCGDTVLVEEVAVLGTDRQAVEVLAGTMAMVGVAVLSARDLGVACEAVARRPTGLPWPRPDDRRARPLHPTPATRITAFEVGR